MSTFKDTDWGQAASNNDIGFGSAVANNDIFWGMIHPFTFGHPRTDLVGLSQVAKDYIARVVAAGGVVEGQDYLTEQLNKFSKYNPTLLNIPAGYGEGKAFSQIPADGSGDLSWGRNSTKERTNGLGNIEEVPPNLFQSSNDISSIWGKIRVTTPDANTIQDDTDTGIHALIQAGAQFNSIGVVTMQVEMEADTFNFVRLYENGGTNGRVMCNLTTGEVSGVGGGNRGQGSVKLSNGRYVFWFSCDTNTLAANGNFQIRLSPDGITDNYTGDGSGRVKVYRMGLFKGNGYQENWGVVTTDRLNVPALDYSTGVQRWSVEPQRGNIIVDSIDYTSSEWLKDQVTITPNAAISPDGTMNATRVTNGASGNYRLRQSRFVDADDTYQYSFWVKKETSSAIRISHQNFDNTAFVDFNFDTEQIVGGTFKKGENGWYRITGNFSTSTDLAGSIAFFGVTPSASTLIWNCQTEKGTYPTSDIITGASAVTRGADGSSTTGLGNILNDSEGALFFEGSFSNIETSFVRLSISDGTTQNFVSFGLNSGSFVGVVAVGGVTKQVLNGGTCNRDQVYKILIKYSVSGIQLWIDGVEVDSTNDSGDFPNNTLSTLNFSSATNNAGNKFYGTVKNLSYYDRALTDAEATEITGGSLFSSYESMAAALNYIIN
jgi:hypothetical protein